MDGAGGNLVGLHLRSCGGKPLLHPLPQDHDGGNQKRSDHHQDDQHGTDHFPLALFLVLVQRFKQRICLVDLFTHKRRSL